MAPKKKKVSPTKPLFVNPPEEDIQVEGNFLPAEPPVVNEDENHLNQISNDIAAQQAGSQGGFLKQMYGDIDAQEAGNAAQEADLKNPRLAAGAGMGILGLQEAGAFGAGASPNAGAQATLGNASALIETLSNPITLGGIALGVDLARKATDPVMQAKFVEADKFQKANMIGDEVMKSATGESLTSQAGGNWDIPRYAAEAVGGAIKGVGTGLRSAGNYVKESIAKPLWHGVQEAVVPGSSIEPPKTDNPQTVTAPMFNNAPSSYPVSGKEGSDDFAQTLAGVIGSARNGVMNLAGQTGAGPVMNAFGINKGNNASWGDVQAGAAGNQAISPREGKTYTDPALISALAQQKNAGPKPLSYKEQMEAAQSSRDPWNFMPDSKAKNDLQAKQAVRVQMADMADQQKGYVDAMADAVARGQKALKEGDAEAKALAQKDFDSATNNLRSLQGQYSAFISMAAGQGAMSEGDKDNLDRANAEVKAQLNSSAGAGGFQSSDGGTQFLRVRQNLDNSLQAQWNFLKSTEAPFRMVADNFGLDDRTFRIISGNDTIDKSYQRIAPYILKDRTGRESVLDAKSIKGMDDMVLAANDLQLQDLLKGAERTGTLEAYVMNASPSALARLKSAGIKLSGINSKVEKQKGVFAKNDGAGPKVDPPKDNVAPPKKKAKVY